MSSELKHKAITYDPAFAYIPDSDRFLTRQPDVQYRFNVIGTGVNGQEHIRVTLMEGRATIHGVYDPSPGSVEGARQEYARYAAGSELNVYESLEAACNDPAVDGLIICTPNYTHLDVLKVAVESGKAILLEKPLATTVKDAWEILQIAQGYINLVQIGLQYRYKAIYQEAIYEALDRQSLGEIKTLSILEHRIPFLDKVNQWNKFTRYSGNTLVEKCCHYFDLLNLFAQARPQSVFATGCMAVNFREFEYEGEKSDILDNAMVNITYQNGVNASFNLCMFAPMIYEELVICGDSARLKAWENHDFLPHLKAGTHLEIIAGEDRPSRVMQPMYPSIIDSSGHNGATYYEHVNFIDNLEGKAANSATAMEGFWSIVVAAAAQESIARGTVIDIETFLVERGIGVAC